MKSSKGFLNPQRNSVSLGDLPKSEDLEGSFLTVDIRPKIIN